MKIFENTERKIATAKDYNYMFDKRDGGFVRWGKTIDDDPQMAPAPELLDIQISTICHKGCPSCYKDSSPRGKNMSLGVFREILKRIPKTVCQVALGIGDIDSNPDLWDIMQATRDAGIIPNITINGYGMSEDHYRNLASLCGAVSVSNYSKDICYSTVAELSRVRNEIMDSGAPTTLKQVNIHQLLHDTTIDQCWELLQDANSDCRLKDLYAIVFLLLKPKGRASHLKPLTDISILKNLTNYAIDNRLTIGFDSCTANSFLEVIKDNPERGNLTQMIEPCESTCFSLYINVDGEAFPCSFAEGAEKWKTGVNILYTDDFVKDVWNHKRIVTFRKDLLEKCRNCPVYNLEMI